MKGWHEGIVVSLLNGYYAQSLIPCKQLVAIMQYWEQQ